MRRSTMFIEINPLPRAECQSAVAYGEIEATVCEDAADVGGHVIAALGIMAKDGIAVPDHARQKGFEIAAYRRIGVLAQHQRGACMLYEHIAQTCSYTRLPNHLFNPAGDLRRPPSGRPHGKAVLIDHGNT